MSTIWKKRDSIYKNACQKIKSFKYARVTREHESQLKASTSATIDMVRPLIVFLKECGNGLEQVLKNYEVFGSEIRETIQKNLVNLTSEVYLYDKVVSRRAR